jgi:hypothetical protein
VASELDFRHVSAADGDGPALVAAMIEEMRELYGGVELNAPDLPTAGATDLAPPEGAFLVGYRIARLDTGPRQPHARGLYESEGYVSIGNFNGNPVATFFGEKRPSG